MILLFNLHFLWGSAWLFQKTLDWGQFLWEVAGTCSIVSITELLIIRDKNLLFLFHLFLQRQFEIIFSKYFPRNSTLFSLKKLLLWLPVVMEALYGTALKDLSIVSETTILCRQDQLLVFYKVQFKATALESTAAPDVNPGLVSLSFTHHISLALRSDSRLLPKHLTGAFMILLLTLTMKFWSLNNAIFTQLWALSLRGSLNDIRYSGIV